MPSKLKFSARTYPFFRLVIALTSGIVLQWYLQISLITAIIILTAAFILLTCFYFLPASKKFIFEWIRGTAIFSIMLCVGIIITWQQNLHNDETWYGKQYTANDVILATVAEPLVEKPNSYKALAKINAINKNNHWKVTEGEVLLYFKKDSSKPALQYGSQIIFNKPIQQIQNSGNPAAFNYNRFCLFQNITGQVFLAQKDYSLLAALNKNRLQNALFIIRDWALHILQQNIHTKKELGIAEALLIGYRNDLDKDIVQAYSNTGVVHIIAISGLHIAVIYAALLKFFTLFKSSKTKRIIEPVIILLIIWMFTLIAGAAPSVLRAAVMFTFILAGKFLQKNSNIYNTLAASAFTILIINPFFLWDVGFQLSYAAVFSIVLFQKSVSGLFYSGNKFLQWIWQLCAVSIAAQVFTLPLVIYHFHQLPLLFLFSNLLVVPLSGVILFAELILFAVSWLPVLASFVGLITETLIRWMNEFIEHLDAISFSVWDGLQISVVQLCLLFIIISLLSFWLFSKNTKNLIAVLVCAFIFFLLNDVSILQHQRQQKLIVYNVPKQTAIDVIVGYNCSFAGDSTVIMNDILRNFNLKASRIKKGVYNAEIPLLPDVRNLVTNINSSKILVLGKFNLAEHISKKIKIDYLILSRDFNKTPADINDMFECNCIIADSSIPQWKSAKWKKEFERLHLRFYSVAQDGAFTANL